MFGSLGVPEILFILVLALLVFGPRRLPEMGRTIGRALGEFRRASTDLRRTLNNELALEDESPRRPHAAPSPPSRPRIAVGKCGVAGAPPDQGVQVPPPVPRPASGTAPRGAVGADAEATAGLDTGAAGSEAGAAAGPEDAGGHGVEGTSGEASGAPAETAAGDGPPIPAPSAEPR
jgi:TatA/E family protein of Tat protein translocase